ncbi:MAG: hypothetical protein KGL50_07160 [Burkholderiales bacterium]|nr:hypothetical protein [Burkholderiales bacterium]
MLRALVALVLLANLLFFGWARGWFEPALPAPRQAEREPERLLAQVHADAVTVLPAPAAGTSMAAASAASAASATAATEAAASAPAAPACLQAGPYAEADLAAAEAALISARLPAAAWTRQPVPGKPGQNWLRVPQADADQQSRLQALPASAVGGGFRPCAGPG